MRRFFTYLTCLCLVLALLCGCDVQPGVEQPTQDQITGQITEQNTETPTERPTEGESESELDSVTDNDTTGPDTTEPETTEPESEESTTAVPEQMPSDPYINVSEAEFYSDYQPAEDYWDSYWRTQHGFMSGYIDPQDQKPTVADYQPMEDGAFVRNTHSGLSEDGKVYYIVDGYGNVVHQIFECGAYVSLEEVAAYVLAFGTIPVNYTSSKRTDPDDSIWGEYLRLNHSKFSGSTTKYPYEPELPNISGCGGRLQYYEIDIGTTGTDCDPSYRAAVYNNGSTITRGAARIVYARFDINGDKLIDINEKYVFYTYNHYNDFQEYLNYWGGWGEMFGNITGGGKISSKTDCNPTPYVPVVRRDLVTSESAQAFVGYVILYYVPKIELLAA